MSSAGSPWTDLDAYVSTPRLGGLLLSPDGSRLLVAISSPDATTTAYQTAWWELDRDGGAPRRLTRSVEGEGFAAFAADGSLLFSSKRSVPPGADGDAAKGSEDDKVLWCLPPSGEAYAFARRSGGWDQVATARAADRLLLAGSAHVSSDDEASHAALTELRRTKKVAAILHEGYPVRFWDHDLGATDTRLLTAEVSTPGPDDLRDVTPTRGVSAGRVTGVSDDGTVALLDWSEPSPRGEVRGVVVALDLRTGSYDTLAGHDTDEFGHGVLSGDGRFVVCVRESASTATTAPDSTLWLIERRSGAGRVLAGDWDAWPAPHAFSPDNATVYVTVDERGHGPLYAVDVATGERRRLTGEGAVASVVLSPDGSTLYATTSSYTDPGSIIAVDTATGAVTTLTSPVSYPALPGRLEDVSATAADGTEIRSFLLLPEGADAEHPAPLALWIHGGPLGSWNAWSWRWCPWLLVAQGYAVLLPDPALSTGYGRAFVQRGWGHWGGSPYEDLMTATDAAVARPDIDGDDTVAMGGSFGGYMANWVAGHTDRFRAIVTHASLWNLESFGPTTDVAWFWAREMTPEMTAAYSPHRFADSISTPMLVIHGDKDYRVPIGEGLALWWDLCRRHEGAAEALPHKFLYFPDENHWVLTPQHALVWYETVIAFLQSVRTGGNFSRPAAL